MSIILQQFQELFGTDGPGIDPVNNSFLNKIESDYNTTFFLDLTTLRYAHMNKNCRELTGYSSNYLVEGGIDSYVNMWTEDGIALYLNRVIPTTMKMLASAPPGHASNYIFGRTYFIKTKNGETRKIFERHIFLFHPSSSAPVAITGWATDITQVSDMNKTTFFVEDASKYGPESILFKETTFVRAEDGILTPKELEVLRWMAEGLISKQIADKMQLSIHTINNHRKNMLAKTNAANAIDLINYAYRQHIL